MRSRYAQDAGGSAVMTGPVGSILLTYRVRREGDQFVAECPELGVGTCGNTIDEAFAMIEDAVELHLNALEEEGERERVFAERNITLFEESPSGIEAAFVSSRLGEYVHRAVVPVHNVAFA